MKIDPNFRWSFSWSDVATMWLMEMRTLARSGRAVTTAVILPLVITPLMLIAVDYSTSDQQRTGNRTFRYAVTGSWADPVRELISAGATPGGDTVPQFVEAAADPDPASALRDGRLHFHIHAVDGPEADFEARGSANDSAGRLDGVPLVRIRFPANRSDASIAAYRMVDILDSARQVRVESLLDERGFDLGFDEILPIDERDVATSVEATGLVVGRFMTLGVFMLILTGGSLVAMDIVAGEKERGTLETLLTSAVGRREIMAAKQLAILSTAVAITVIQVGNLLAYTQLDLIPLPDGFDFRYTPAEAGAVLLVMLPMAVLLSALLLLLSAVSKSYKEAQLYFFPVYLAGMIPAATGALDIPLRSAVAIVPIAGVSVAVREVLSGQLDWAFVAIVAAVNALAAGAVLRTAVRLLDDEAVATNRQSSPIASLDGASAFRAGVWQWFAVIWALFIGIGLTLPDLTMQVIVTQFFLLGGAVLVAIRRYRLDAAHALGVHFPRWTTWPIALLLVFPLHMIAGLVMRFANTMFPVPETYLQQLEQQFEPLAAMPWVSAVFLIAVAPGVFEEFAFRGLLFFGLEKRYGRWGLAIVVGLVFGFFHFDLSRIVMAGTLGIFLTLARIFTGSILPGIAIHVANNSLALALGQAGFPVDRLDAVVYVFAAVATLALFRIMWRENRPTAGPGSGDPPS